MKILFDENLPHALRKHLPNHEVVTAAYAGLAGLKNGELLTAAETPGFDVIITGDKTLEFEQRIADRQLALVAPSSNVWKVIQPYLAGIAAAVDSAKPGSVARVECGRFSRLDRRRQD